MKLPKKRSNDLQTRLRGAGTDVRDVTRNKGAQVGKEIARQYQKMDVSWARKAPASVVRGGLLAGILTPLLFLYVKRRVAGREVLGDEMTDPVIFVANHSSHLDTPTILRAMPTAWRKRTAVAAAADYFYKSRWRAWALRCVQHVPMGRTGGGLNSGASDHVHELHRRAVEPADLPEGTRSRDGDIGKVKSGAAVLAAQHGLNIVPIWVGGTHEAMPPGQNWPKRLRGRFFSRRVEVEVRFGPPISPRDTSERREVMARGARFLGARGPAGQRRGAPSAHDVLIMHAALRAHERQLTETAERRTATPLIRLIDPPYTVPG